MGGWDQVVVLTDPTPADSSGFGTAIDIDGSYVVVGEVGGAWMFCLDGGCSEAASGDINGDGDTNGGDLMIVLSEWGNCVECSADIDGDGLVGVNDLLAVVACWG